MNAMLRTETKNEFEKDFFKFMNDSILGKLWKILENIEILNQKKEEIK